MLHWFIWKHKLYNFIFIGDVMGSSINNLEQLVRMPYGCGEQNMVRFAPLVFVMKYLHNTNQLTEKIRRKAIRFMESGNQRLTIYLLK